MMWGIVMTVFSVWYLIALLSLMVVLHIASVLIDGNLSFYINCVNICLHICGIFLLMLACVSIDEAVLFYMISVFAYTLAYEVKHLISERLAARQMPKDDELAVSQEEELPPPVADMEVEA